MALYQASISIYAAFFSFEIVKVLDLIVDVLMAPSLPSPSLSACCCFNSHRYEN